jgi:hypothetical protein
MLLANEIVHGSGGPYMARMHPAKTEGWREIGETSHEKALALTQQEPERQFLQDRIRQLK